MAGDQKQDVNLKLWAEYRQHISTLNAKAREDKRAFDALRDADDQDRLAKYTALPWYRRVFRDEPRPWWMGGFYVDIPAFQREATVEGYYDWLVKREADSGGKS